MGIKKWCKRVTIYRKKQHGYTLIELLIVFSIMSILLTTIAIIINPSLQFKKARDARRKTDIQRLKVALEAYYNENGHYPLTGPGNFNIWNSSAEPGWAVLQAALVQ